MSIAPRDARIENFADYMLETYISEEARFPPEMWTAIPNAMPERTNNGCEAFHRHFKSSFNSSHPNIFLFSKALLEQQTLTYIKIQNMNADAILSRNEMKKRNFVVEAYQQ